MNAISAIRQNDDIYSFTKRGAKPARDEEAPIASWGPDTVSFSNEALQKAMGEADGDAKSALDATRRDEKETEPSAKQLTKTASKSIFSMLLESLFLADLEEAEASGAAPDGNAQPGTEGGSGETSAAPEKMTSVNPLRDGEKSAALKKALSDFANGKADVSDLPRLMAVGASGGGAPTYGKTGQPQNAADPATPDSATK